MRALGVQRVMKKYVVSILILLLLGCVPAKPADETIHLKLADSGYLYRQKETIDIPELAAQLRELKAQGKTVEIVVSANSNQDELLHSIVQKIKVTPGLDGISIVTIIMS